MKKIILRFYLCVSLCLFLFSCSSDDDDKVDEILPIVNSISVIDTVKVDEIKEAYTYYMDSLGVDKTMTAYAMSKLKYDVVFTKVEYKAKDPFGKTRTLSGLVGYPVLPQGEKNKELKIVSIQHGTIEFESEAPSRSTFNRLNMVDALRNMAPAFEGGYISVNPDYFGYGSDENGLHYYEHRSSLAEATRRLIEAIPSMATKQSLTVSKDKLMLFGYSEGGFATMSTLMSFSQTGSFKEYVTVAGAGAYDKLGTAKTVVQQTSGESPTFTASYSWVLLTYNKVYKINKTLDELFNPEVKSIISPYVDTDNIMQVRVLPSAPSQVFNTDFASGLANETDKVFIDALKDNNVTDFEAKGSVLLIHGLTDTWVPVSNTDVLYNKLKEKSVDVKRELVSGANHQVGYLTFILKSFEKLL